MEATRSTIEESERLVLGLQKRGEQIETILTVIEDVTAETALLALNAAIIASQAGEHGRAFGVVGDEMRALADRVSASTKEIDAVVRAVQAESARAAESILQQTLAEVRHHLPGLRRIHLFYAGPTGGAIVVGQAINPRMNPPIALYEYDRQREPAYVNVLNLPLTAEAVKNKPESEVARNPEPDG